MPSSKLKTFDLRDTVKEMKSQATDWEKILANRISDKELHADYRESLIA